MEKINLNIEYKNLINVVEQKARMENNLSPDDKVEDFRIDLRDKGCRKVCITIGGKEFCWCL